MNDNNIPLLEVRGVKKDFFSNVVLKDINFTLNPGEILGLVGENGAGKSTLMKILFGMKEITETGGYDGSILLNGKEVKFKSSFDALNAGFGMVHQEFSLLPDFTATENIVLNRESQKYSFASEFFGDRLNTLDREDMRKRAVKAIEKLQVNLDENMLVSGMPVGHKQFTEISRELSRDGMKILILDEPTAVLTEKEADSLLVAMRRLKEHGIAIIFITHRLHEIIDVCDKIIVMRDGKIVENIKNENVKVRQIAKAMVGREVSSIKDNSERNQSDNVIEKKQSDNQPSNLNSPEIIKDSDVVLELKHLWVDMPGEIVHDVNLRVKKGEILGIAGLAGQGKLGIPNGIMGLYNRGGEVIFEGKTIPKNNPKKCIADGMAFVSEDRRGVGLLLDESLEWNVAFGAMQAQNKFVTKILGGAIKWRNSRSIEKATNEYIKDLQIKCTSSKQKARELSGGNQQKICLAKAFALGPRLLFVSEATRGIDIGAKALVLDALKKYNKEYGVTIVMVSSELEELRSVCSRIAVITDGKVAGILNASNPSDDFGLLMVAGHDDKEAV